jgi:hypothetical protein
MPVGDRTLNPDKSIAMGGRFKLASLFRKGVEGHFDEVYANARLIAAAPELLRALVVALHSMDRNDEPGSPARDGAIDQAHEAIAKAEGK